MSAPKWHLYIGPDTTACGVRGDVLFTEDPGTVTCFHCLKRFLREPLLPPTPDVTKGEPTP